MFLKYKFFNICEGGAYLIVKSICSSMFLFINMSYILSIIQVCFCKYLFVHVTTYFVKSFVLQILIAVA